MKKIIILLVVIIVLFLSCQSEKSYLLPLNAKNINYLGNGWVTFTLGNDIFLFLGNNWKTAWAITKIGELE